MIYILRLTAHKAVLHTWQQGYELQVESLLLCSEASDLAHSSVWLACLRSFASVVVLFGPHEESCAAG